MTNGRKIAVCVDDSMHSEKAWLWAIGNFLRPDDQVTLITVASPTADDLAGVGSYNPLNPNPIAGMPCTSSSTWS